MTENEETLKETPTHEETTQDSEQKVDSKTILENWEQIKEIPIQDYFAKGWKPLRKKMTTGVFIYLRKQWKEEDGWKESTKSLGPYDELRWQLIQEMYPFKRPPSLPPSTDSQNLGDPLSSDLTLGGYKPSSLLGTKVAKPLPATVHLDLETLLWWKWTQENTEYKGDFDKFINDSVKGFFKEFLGKELAVIHQKE